MDIRVYKVYEDGILTNRSGKLIMPNEYSWRFVMYNYGRQIDIPFEKAVDKLKKELEKEGFGVITEIDVKATLHKKLGIEMDSYLILGACNPNFAYQALQAEKEMGLLMPCNTIVYEQEGKTNIAAIMPTVTTSTIKNDKLHAVMLEAEEALKKVIDSV